MIFMSLLNLGPESPDEELARSRHKFQGPIMPSASSVLHMMDDGGRDELL